MNESMKIWKRLVISTSFQHMSYGKAFVRNRLKMGRDESLSDNDGGGCIRIEDWTEVGGEEWAMFYNFVIEGLII